MVDKGQVTDDIAQEHQNLNQADSESQKGAQNENENNGTSISTWGLHAQPHLTPTRIDPDVLLFSFHLFLNI